MTYWSVLALQRLGREQEARLLSERLLQHSYDLETHPAVIDYFATSLPALLLFEDDLQARAQIHAQMLRAAALQGLGKADEACALAQQVLQADPNCAFARYPLEQATDPQLSSVSQ